MIWRKVESDRPVADAMVRLAAGAPPAHKQCPERAAYLQGLILAHLEQERQAGSVLADELSDDEMAGLAEHLKKLGYVE